MPYFISVKPGLYIVVTIARTCLRSCSKEGFKAVNISFTNIPCEIQNTCNHYNYVKTKAYLES